MKISKYYRSFLRRKLNQENRRKLKNYDFTIISSNCVGGVITHELGQRFNSPTVNLYFNPEDYLKFLKNLKYYILECEFQEDKELSREKGYPVGILGDIRMFFVHYATFDEAIEKWTERCKRIHWDNMYFLMTQRDGCTEEQVKQFDELPYKHKVIFTSKSYEDIKSAVYIKNSVQENGEVMDLNFYKNKFTGIRMIDDFDYVSFLNQK